MHPDAAGFVGDNLACLDLPPPPVELVLRLCAPPLQPRAAGFVENYLACLDLPPHPVELLLCLCARTVHTMWTCIALFWWSRSFGGQGSAPMGLGSVDGFHPPQGHGRVARQVAPANNNFVVAAKRLLGGGTAHSMQRWI